MTGFSSSSRSGRSKTALRINPGLSVSSMLPLLVSLILSVFLVAECDHQCPEKLQKVDLAPKYTRNVPRGDVKILYDKSYEVKCGNELPVLATKAAPLVVYDVKGKCTNVSIIFFDPDVPVLNNLFLHWFVSNIPASVMKKGYEGQAGTERVSYFSPLGPTGDHRYTFCVYCQRRYIRGGRTNRGTLSRMGIDPKRLANQNRLDPPEACNFFYLTAVDASKLKDLPVL